MIWLQRALGEPFELTLTTLAPLDDVEVTAAARSPNGALWPMEAGVTDAALGRIRIDGRGVGRVWPAGILWLDWRLSRHGVTIRSATFGVIVLDGPASAEAARREIARPLAPGQRRVWTLDGEVLDALCLRELGSERAAAAVLGLNPGLAEFGPILPGGLGLVLPAAAAPATRAPVRLWGTA